MEKFCNEIINLNVINEDENMSRLVEDINPPKEVRFTDLELEADKQQEFSLVLYKKENIFSRIMRNIRLSMEKLKIAKHSKNVSLISNISFENNNK